MTTTKQRRPQIGDEVIDLTAALNRWADCHGVIIEVDGNNALVEYQPSGNTRWKSMFRLQVVNQP